MGYEELIAKRKVERAREFLHNAMYLLDSLPEAIEDIKGVIKKIDEQT